MARSSSCAVLVLLLACSWPATAQRTLQATAPNCKDVHPECNSCTLNKATASSPAVLVCKSCSVGYVPYMQSPTKSTCACKPGYYSPGANLVCRICPKDSFCKGGNKGGAKAEPCQDPNNSNGCLGTLTTGAQNSSSCITKAGCAYKIDTSTALGFVGTPCVVGKFSTGGTKTLCQPCPAGLTTTGTHSTSIDACSAPPGFYFQNRKALPCPQGTWKAGTDKAAACSPCPTNLTTAGEGKRAAGDCNVAKVPGYIAIPDGAGFKAAPCPVGTYSSDGRVCTSCQDDLTTEREAATTAAECLAGPGYGYSTQRSPRTKQCGNGEYKAGWNLNDCQSCGANFQTDTSDTNGLGLSIDQCFLPVGWGSTLDGSIRRLIARPCVAGTYGATERVYGSAPRPCQPCPENTATPDQFLPQPGSDAGPYSSPEACQAKPGYGWSNRVATACPVGEFKELYSNLECQPCGDGLTTVATGASSTSDCLPLPGWAKHQQSDRFAFTCPVGSYSEGGTSALADCTLCASGSTTEYPGSTENSQCSVCSPGWGQNSYAANGGTMGPLCDQCSPGFYSPGGDDDACTQCEQGQVSPPGASDSSECLDEFMSTAPYDFISTPAAQWVDPTTLTGGPSTQPADVNACEDACRSYYKCMYFVFRADMPAEESASAGCWLRVAPQTADADTFVALKLWTSDYSIWQVTQAEYATVAVPDNLLLADSDRSRCLDACDNLSSCMGVFLEWGAGSWQCYRLDGEFATSGVVTSAVKAAPYQMNTWNN